MVLMRSGQCRARLRGGDALAASQICPAVEGGQSMEGTGKIPTKLLTLTGAISTL
jgi:hypothetical protein